MSEGDRVARQVAGLDVPLDGDIFMRTLVRELANVLRDIVGAEQASGFISVAGQTMGHRLDEQYRAALKVPALSREQVAAVLVDLKRRIGGDFEIVEQDDRRIVIGARKCPFGDQVVGQKTMCMMTSNVRDGTQRMGRLIDDILAFSRTGRGEIAFTEIDMTALARTVFEELLAAAPGRELKLDLEPLPAARGDPLLVRQVLTNLLGNAVKFTRGRSPALVTVRGAVDGAEAVYSVKDDGVGFDMRHVGKLFGVFQRLHGSQEFEGTGIGLAIVKRIVTRHGGRVWGQGEVGGGATFHFTLPRGGTSRA